MVGIVVSIGLNIVSFTSNSEFKKKINGIRDQDLKS
jgi:hypothetical protein